MRTLTNFAVLVFILLFVASICVVYPRYVEIFQDYTLPFCEPEPDPRPPAPSAENKPIIIPPAPAAPQIQAPAPIVNTPTITPPDPATRGRQTRDDTVKNAFTTRNLSDGGCTGYISRLVTSPKIKGLLDKENNDRYPTRRSNPTIVRRSVSNRPTDLGKYGYPMYIGRLRGGDQDKWMWSINDQGILEFSDNPTQFVFEPADASKNGMYFRFQDDLLIRIASGPFANSYLGDFTTSVGGRCARIVAARPSQSQANYFVVAPYYDTCDKNCPQPSDRHCAPVLFYEHCRPEIRMKVDDGTGSYYRVIGYGKNPATNFRTWDWYKYVAAQNNAYPKPDPYENPSTVIFLDVDPNGKQGWGDYDEFEYDYSSRSAWNQLGMCRACMIYTDESGRQV